MRDFNVWILVICCNNLTDIIYYTKEMNYLDMFLQFAALAAYRGFNKGFIILLQA